MKAYAIRCKETDKPLGIVYHEYDISARREGARLYRGGDFLAVSARRAPWADDYADQKIPKRVFKDNKFIVKQGFFRGLFG